MMEEMPILVSLLGFFLLMLILSIFHFSPIVNEYEENEKKKVFDEINNFDNKINEDIFIDWLDRYDKIPESGRHLDLILISCKYGMGICLLGIGICYFELTQLDQYMLLIKLALVICLIFSVFNLFPVLTWYRYYRKPKS